MCHLNVTVNVWNKMIGLEKFFFIDYWIFLGLFIILRQLSYPKMSWMEIRLFVYRNLNDKFAMQCTCSKYIRRLLVQLGCHAVYIYLLTLQITVIFYPSLSYIYLAPCNHLTFDNILNKAKPVFLLTLHANRKCNQNHSKITWYIFLRNHVHLF